MERVRAIGGGIALLSIAGYLVGVLAPYPGRSFTITGLMAGLTLYAVGGRYD
jgi:hypothetical protein